MNMETVGMIVIGWLIAAGIFLLLEIFTMGLTTIWFAGGAVMGAVFAKLGLPVWTQVVAFVVVSVVLLAVTRPLAKKYLNGKTVRTNADSLIGCIGLVTQTIHNLKAQGQVTVRGQVWTARSTEEDIVIKEGTRVKITAISGVKLLVEPEER